MKCRTSALSILNRCSYHLLMAKIKTIGMVIRLTDDDSKTIYIRPHVIFPMECCSNCKTLFLLC